MAEPGAFRRQISLPFAFILSRKGVSMSSESSMEESAAEEFLANLGQSMFRLPQKKTLSLSSLVSMNSSADLSNRSLWSSPNRIPSILFCPYTDKKKIFWLKRLKLSTVAAKVPHSCSKLENPAFMYSVLLTRMSVCGLWFGFFSKRCPENSLTLALPFFAGASWKVSVETFSIVEPKRTAARW